VQDTSYCVPVDQIGLKFEQDTTSAAASVDVVIYIFCCVCLTSVAGLYCITFSTTIYKLQVGVVGGVRLSTVMIDSGPVQCVHGGRHHLLSAMTWRKLTFLSADI